MQNLNVPELLMDLDNRRAITAIAVRPLHHRHDTEQFDVPHGYAIKCTNRIRCWRPEVAYEW